jgi:hypothetical protein
MQRLRNVRRDTWIGLVGFVFVMALIALLLGSCGPAGEAAAPTSGAAPTAAPTTAPTAAPSTLKQAIVSPPQEAELAAINAATGITFQATVDAMDAASGITTFEAHSGEAGLFFGLSAEGDRDYASVVTRTTPDGTLAGHDQIEALLNAWNGPVSAWVFTELFGTSPNTYLGRCRLPDGSVTDIAREQTANDCTGAFVQRDGAVVTVIVPKGA